MKQRIIPIIALTVVFPAWAHAAPATFGLETFSIDAFSEPLTVSTPAEAETQSVDSTTMLFESALPIAEPTVETTDLPTAEPVVAPLDQAVAGICGEEGFESTSCQEALLEYATYELEFSLFPEEPDDKPSGDLSLQILVAKVKIQVMDMTHPKKTDANTEFNKHIADFLDLALAGNKDARQAIIDLSKESVKNIDIKKIISDVLKEKRDAKGTSDNDKAVIDGILKDIGK